MINQHYIVKALKKQSLIKKKRMKKGGNYSTVEDKTIALISNLLAGDFERNSFRQMRLMLSASEEENRRLKNAILGTIHAIVALVCVLIILKIGEL